MLEKDIQREILRYLRLLGHYAIKTPAGLIKTQKDRIIRMGDAGQTDITVGIKTPTAWEIGFLEVKLSTGRVSESQKFTLRDHNAKGRRWLVACDIDDVEEWLKNPEYHGKEKFVKQVFHDKKRRERKKRVGYEPLKGTKWENLKELRDKRIEVSKPQLEDIPF